MAPGLGTAAPYCVVKMCSFRKFSLKSRRPEMFDPNWRNEAEMFCCRGFAIMLESAGNSGISALVVNRSDNITFRMQSRSVSIEDEERFTNNDTPLSVNFKLSFTTGIRYCPLCGTELKKLINEETKQNLLELAERHRQIDNSL